MSMADDSQPTVPGSAPTPQSPVPDGSAPGPQPTQPTPPTPPAPPAEPPSTAETPPLPPPEPGQQPETLIDAIADLLQMVVNWLRQEAAGVMRDKVILPLQQLGFTLFSACAAVTLFVIGLCFLFVALLLVLAHYLGWPLALTVVGVAILIGCAIFTYQKWRTTQK